MSRLRWNNQNQRQARHQTSVFHWREGWMARTILRPQRLMSSPTSLSSVWATMTSMPSTGEVHACDTLQFAAEIEAWGILSCGLLGLGLLLRRLEREVSVKLASCFCNRATGWSEPVPGRELHPLKSSAFPRRTFSLTTLPIPSKRNRAHAEQ